MSKANSDHTTGSNSTKRRAAFAVVAGTDVAATATASAPAAAKIDHAQLVGWHFICGKPGAELVEGLSDRQRVRAINKVARLAASEATVAAAALVRGSVTPSGHPLSPSHQRKWMQRGMEAARRLLSIMEAGDAYLATLPEPVPVPTV